MHICNERARVRPQVVSTAVEHHLAQLNVARLRAPLDSQMLVEFVEALEPVNALADDAQGFVWRLQTEDGDATAIRAFEDDMLLVNMSVWESVDDLAVFVYRSDHRRVMIRRREWFERMVDSSTVLWWVEAGHRPNVIEAKQRLATLRRDGPTPAAFTFRSPFPPPGAGGVVEVDERWACPTG